MPTFFRGSFTNIQITISSNEELGVLDSDYVEDYFGTDGQITLRESATGTRHDVLMAEVPGITPSIPHDVFRGFYPLASLPNGTYFVEGRVRDLAGNYTILTAVQNPVGGERVISMSFDIAPGVQERITADLGAIRVSGAAAFTLSVKRSSAFAMGRFDRT